MIRLPGLIAEQRIIAVARGQDATSAPGLAEALRAGGLDVLEITVESKGGFEAIASIAGGGTEVGAGTVTTVDQAALAVEAGATFLVSPHLDEALVAWSQASGVPYIPGVLTPTEISAALRNQVPAVKLFPASLGGPDLVRAMLGPYPDLPIIPTGGVNDTNAADYLGAGALAVGVGAWLTGGADLDLVAKRARSLVSIAR